MDVTKSFRVYGIVAETQQASPVRVDLVEIVTLPDETTTNGARISISGVEAVEAPPYGAIVEVPFTYPSGGE